MLMVGRLGAKAVGAVGLATQILGAVRAGIAAVGTGTVALVARYIGANDRDNAEEVLKQSVVFGVLVSTIIAIPVIVFARPLMTLFQVKGEMAEMGARYLQVVMLSEPFQGIFLMCASALRGAGDTRTPLWIGGIIDVIAIFLNYVLIFGKFGFPALGVDGSAVATLIAIAVGGMLFFWALSIDGMVLNFRWKRLWPDFGARQAHSERRQSRRDRAAHRSSSALSPTSRSSRATAPRKSPHTSSACGFSRCRSCPASGFPPPPRHWWDRGSARATRSSRARPDGNRPGMAIVLMTAMGLVFIIFARQIAALFIDDHQVINVHRAFMYALAAAQPLMAIDWTITGALRGAGDSRFPLYGSLAGFYGMRLFLTILIAHFHGPIIWIWWSLIADYIVRSTMKAWRFRSGKWETIEV